MAISNLAIRKPFIFLGGPKGRGNLLRDGQTSASSRRGEARRSPAVEPKKPSLSLRLLRFARNDTHQ